MCLHCFCHLRTSSSSKDQECSFVKEHRPVLCGVTSMSKNNWATRDFRRLTVRDRIKSDMVKIKFIEVWNIFERSKKKNPFEATKPNWRKKRKELRCWNHGRRAYSDHRETGEVCTIKELVSLEKTRRLNHKHISWRW